MYRLKMTNSSAQQKSFRQKKYPTIGKLLDNVRPSDELLGRGSRNSTQNGPGNADKVALSDRIKNDLQRVFTSSPIKDKQEFEKQLNERIVSHVELELRKYLDELQTKKIVGHSDDHHVDCKIKADMDGPVVKQIVKVKIKCSNLVVEKAMAVAVGHSRIHYNNGGQSNLPCGCKIKSSCATHGAGK
ncbi:unnamed protein product [Lymnaea stagnalis]|uniref:Uncharacterized protein n=1 Tax=Lymnaea stagnalis TaxID=6523 RepID=A0AAV2I2G2_LYMST